MKKPIVVFALAAFAASSLAPVFADDAPGGGVENGADIGAFFGSGPVIDRDAMDEAAERENRKAYLDQDPKMPAHISPPKGSGATQTVAQSAAGGNGTNQKPHALKRFFRTIGEVLSPDWLLDVGLGPDNDTDFGPDNNNKKY